MDGNVGGGEIVEQFTGGVGRLIADARAPAAKALVLFESNHSGWSNPAHTYSSCRAVRSNWKECARLYMRSRSWRVREPKSMLRASWGINSSAEAAGHHATHPAPAETCFLQSRLPLVRNEIILFPWDLLPFIPDQPYV